MHVTQYYDCRLVNRTRTEGLTYQLNLTSNKTWNLNSQKAQAFMSFVMSMPLITLSLVIGNAAIKLGFYYSKTTCHYVILPKSNLINVRCIIFAVSFMPTI